MPRLAGPSRLAPFTLVIVLAACGRDVVTFPLHGDGGSALSIVTGGYEARWVSGGLQIDRGRGGRDVSLALAGGPFDLRATPILLVRMRRLDGRMEPITGSVRGKRQASGPRGEPPAPDHAIALYPFDTGIVAAGAPYDLWLDLGAVPGAPVPDAFHCVVDGLAIDVTAAPGSFSIDEVSLHRRGIASSLDVASCRVRVPGTFAHGALPLALMALGAAVAETLRGAAARSPAGALAAFRRDAFVLSILGACAMAAAEAARLLDADPGASPGVALAAIIAATALPGAAIAGRADPLRRARRDIAERGVVAYLAALLVLLARAGGGPMSEWLWPFAGVAGTVVLTVVALGRSAVGRRAALVAAALFASSPAAGRSAATATAATPVALLAVTVTALLVRSSPHGKRRGIVGLALGSSALFGLFGFWRLSLLFQPANAVTTSLVASCVPEAIVRSISYLGRELALGWTPLVIAFAAVAATARGGIVRSHAWVPLAMAFVLGVSESIGSLLVRAPHEELLATGAREMAFQLAPLLAMSGALAFEREAGG
ncbi:MAG: hypothetical protein U0166_10190 [Acidobacteriota bacterium]